jgi:hypothetical protein
MTGDRACAHCGGPMPAGRQGRWCSSWCRGRDEQGLPPQPPPGLVPVASSTAPAPVVVRAPAAGQLEQRVRAALADAGVDGEWAAEAAFGLAARIEDGSAKGTALAALHRELRAVMGELLKGSGDTWTSVGRHRDELASRRAQRTGDVG